MKPLLIGRGIMTMTKHTHTYILDCIEIKMKMKITNIIIINISKEPLLQSVFS